MIGVPNSVLAILARDPTVARAMGASRRRMLTTLLLALPVDAFELVGWYRRALVDGRFSSDPAIIFSLFRVLDRKRRIDLATSFGGSSLDTMSFAKLVSRVYRTCAPNNRERDRLAETISRHAAVFRNISAPAFEKLVRRLLKSRRRSERMHGVLSLESLSGLHPDLCLRLTQLVRDPDPYVSCNAWSGATRLLQRGRLTAEAHQSLIKDSLAALKDKNELVRGNARYFRRRSRVGAAGADRDLRAGLGRRGDHQGIAIGVMGP